MMPNALRFAAGIMFALAANARKRADAFYDDVERKIVGCECAGCAAEANRQEGFACAYEACAHGCLLDSHAAHAIEFSPAREKARWINAYAKRHPM